VGWGGVDLINDKTGFAAEHHSPMRRNPLERPPTVLSAPAPTPQAIAIKVACLNVPEALERERCALLHEGQRAQDLQYHDPRLHPDRLRQMKGLP